MAPGIQVLSQQQPPQQPPGSSGANGTFDYKEVSISSVKDYNAEKELNGDGKFSAARYPKYLPSWEPVTETLPPLEGFEHYEHGRDADPKLPNLFPQGEAHYSEDITGNLGAEVHNIQLSQLDSKGKDELALFVARKKVVAFRNQDFASLPIQDALDYGSYFGRLHVHPTSPAPAGHPEVHLIHRGVGNTFAADFLSKRTNSTAWHSDITYERQPPGTTFLYILDTPTAGGDTLFCNMVEAYNRLSPQMQSILEGLHAVHSAQQQADGATANGGIVRRKPVTSVHPVIRTHPATGEKALYVNAQFTRQIVGFKKEESDWMLKFLFEHIALGQDYQCRLRWRAGTVIVWDNRVTTHSATVDWLDGQRRHVARITPQAEPPTL